VPGYEDEPLETMERQIFNCMLPGDYHLETLKLCKEVRSTLRASSRSPSSVPAGGRPGVQVAAPVRSTASPRSHGPGWPLAACSLERRQQPATWVARRRLLGWAKLR
jgi:hypothetical protein